MTAIIASTGYDTILAGGFVYNITGNPTLSDSIGYSDFNPLVIKGYFVGGINGLDPNQKILYTIICNK